MPLTTPQIEEIAGLAQRGRMGHLNDVADKWGVPYLDVARAFVDARRALNSPAGSPALLPPVDPAPTANTLQEVQRKMPRGTPNENHPSDAEIIRLVAELKEQGPPNLMKALAERLGVKLGTARNWHYKAQGGKGNKSATPAFACETCRDSGYVGGGNAGVICECPTGLRIAGQVQAALAEPAGAPVLGNVPLVDAPASSTAGATGGMLADLTKSGVTMTVTAGRVMRNPLADVTASAMPSAPVLRIDVPAGQQLHDFAHGFTLGNEVGVINVVAMEKRIAELQAEVHERTIMLEAVVEGAKADRATLEQSVARLEALAREHSGLVATANTNVASLMAENEQLQADLKAAVQTIEQAAPGCVIYQLFGDDLSGRPDVLTMAPGEALSRGDEWPQVIRSAGGPRRVYVWHCVDTITLSGGNVVCTLRPGCAETAEEVA